MHPHILKSEETGVWVMDMQQRLFPRIERCHDIVDTVCFVLKAARLLKLPVFVTEQYPEGLGPTVDPIQKELPSGQPIYAKTTFSGYADPSIRKFIDKHSVPYWILVGFEAHICILQTAKDLLSAGKKVIILSDAIGSRFGHDHATALSEMRDLGVRISSAETIFYELIRDASSPQFKEFISLVKQNIHV